MLLVEVEKDLAEKPWCNTPLAVTLAFQLGLRLGELVALKWDDVEGNYIHVQRAEILDFELLDNGTIEFIGAKIVNHTKSSAGDRYVYLSTKARDILGKIKEINNQYGYEYNDFIFVSEKGRTVANHITNYLQKHCNKMGIQLKGIHKIRKTYISALIDNNVNINTIRELVGHQDERTTYKSYCFSRLSDLQTERKLEMALEEA